MYSFFHNSIKIKYKTDVITLLQDETGTLSKIKIPKVNPPTLNKRVHHITRELIERNRRQSQR